VLNSILEGRYAVYSRVEWPRLPQMVFAMAQTAYKLEETQTAVGGSLFISRVCKACREFYCNLSIDPPAPAAALAIPWDGGILYCYSGRN
jgi:hypothetical protein